MSLDESKLSRLEREVQRLRTSPSLRLGAHITNAIKKPWKAPFLIITLPIMMVIIGFELLGWKSQPNALISKFSEKQMLNPKCVVMFPTNGVGFGHFTRMLAVAKRMKKLDPDLEIIFFTTMPTLHLLKPHGIPAHHIAGPKYFRDMNSEEWNTLLEEELIICLDTHRPNMFLFDGAFPYRGMLRAIQGRSKMSKLWMRRGTFRKGSSIPVDSVECFDTIIHPGDAVASEEQGVEHSVEVKHIPPIILVKEDEMLSKEEARSRLGVPQSAEVWYVQLGAGQINDIQSEIRLTIDALLKHSSELFIIIGESLLGKRTSFSNERVRILRDYPNAIYFNGFDYSIQAGGYNSFHEMRTSRIPTIFYPNMNTGMDDQLARCKVAEEEGWGIVVKKRDVKSISQAIREVVNIDTNNGNLFSHHDESSWITELLAD